MKSLGIMTLAASLEFKPKHPERTAKRDRGWDIEFVEFRSREAMAARIQKNLTNSTDPVYYPVVPFKYRSLCID